MFQEIMAEVLKKLAKKKKHEPTGSGSLNITQDMYIKIYHGQTVHQGKVLRCKKENRTPTRKTKLMWWMTDCASGNLEDSQNCQPGLGCSHYDGKLSECLDDTMCQPCQAQFVLTDINSHGVLYHEQCVHSASGPCVSLRAGGTEKMTSKFFCSMLQILQLS